MILVIKCIIWGGRRGGGGGGGGGGDAGLVDLAFLWVDIDDGSGGVLVVVDCLE